MFGEGEEGELEQFHHEDTDPLERAEEATVQEEQEQQVQDISVQENPTSSTCTLSPDLDICSSHPDMSSPSMEFPHPGPTIDCDANSDPYDFFVKIWGEETFKLIKDETNQYAFQKGITWEIINEDELRAFLGIHISMGLVKLPSLKDYWSTHLILVVPRIVRGMSRNRFTEILSNLHLSDNEKAPERGTPSYDRLYKVRPLINIIIANSQASYHPHQQVAVDEAMVLFKGRSSLKQYMPLKPIKRGFKCWCVCDSHNGFVLNMDVYQGAGERSDKDGLAAGVVMKLLQPLYNYNYEAYMDNFFSSINLAKRLREKGLCMIGTARSNRKYWPESLKSLKTLQKSMSRGDSRSVMVDGVECVVWMDNKAVALINNITTPGASTQVLRRNKDGSRTEVPCPESVKHYNKYMGGVDVFDSRRKTYSFSRKSRKWWHRLFYFLVDAAITNSYILYKETRGTKRLTQKEFVLQLVEHLMSFHSSRKRASNHDGPTASRLCERHFPAKLPENTYRQCCVCSERQRTAYCCRDCSSETPVPLCPARCFKVYHTKLDYGKK